MSEYYGILKTPEQTIYLEKAICIIGRNPSCNIIINVNYVYPSILACRKNMLL